MEFKANGEGVMFISFETLGFLKPYYTVNPGG